VALKRPSEFFKKDIISIDNSVQDLIARPDLGTFSDAFETFRNNLTKFEVVSEQVKEIKNEIENLLKKEDLDNAMMCQLFIVEDSIKNIQDKVEGINKKDLNEIKSDVYNLTEFINDAIYRFNDSLEIEDNFKEKITEKVTDLHLEIVRNESHIRVQNKNLQVIQENVKQTLKKINLEEIERSNYELGKKVKYLEEVFEKFSEKEFLTENILTEPPSTNNEDPLTPLDQNFVTLEQLQAHYRVFINRVQQQLATLGGGGETRFEFLDDIDRNSVKQDGYVIQYSSSAGKFIGTSYVPGGGGNAAITISDTPPENPQPGNLWYDKEIGRTFIYYNDDDGSQWVDSNPSGTTISPTYWISTNVGIHTLSNVGIGTTNPTATLDVQGGDIRVGLTTSNGLILTSPSGNKYRLIVDDFGTLSTVPVV
jgi:hypothetical protein